MRSMLLALAIVTQLTRVPIAQSPDRASFDRAIAEAFAPVFHQGMVGSRYDFITSFDFDGDWVGDNNWDNAAKPEFPQRGYVYYAVSETPTHYFIHYAAFHPRDYKGGELTGAMLSQVLRRGVGASTRIQQTGIANDVVLAHENDLEGCLVVVRKGATLAASEVVIVETLAHNRYLKYQRDVTLAGTVGTIRVDGQHPLIYVEPKGHGMAAFSDQPHPVAADPATVGGDAAAAGGGDDPAAGGGLVERLAGLVTRVDDARRTINGEQPEFIRVYRFTGSAVDPELTDGEIGYDLLPTFETMWARAQRVPNETYGEAQDYGRRSVTAAAGTPAVRTTELGRLGSSFRGVQGAANKARPPWGWFDMTEPDRPLGEWFLDPAAAVLRHFPSSGIDVHYLHQPFLGITRTP